jgi:hypothetical protein
MSMCADTCILVLYVRIHMLYLNGVSLIFVYVLIDACGHVSIKDT